MHVRYSFRMDLTPIPDPWVVREECWPNVSVTFDLLPSALDGYTCFPYDGSAPKIVLCRTLTEMQIRCTLAHEIKHLENGEPAGQQSTWAEELAVRDATARWLLPDLHVIADDLRAAAPWDAAAAMRVTIEVLQDRMQMLTGAESLMLRDWRDLDAAA